MKNWDGFDWALFFVFASFFTTCTGKACEDSKADMSAFGCQVHFGSK